MNGLEMSDGFGEFFFVGENLFTLVGSATDGLSFKSDGEVLLHELTASLNSFCVPTNVVRVVEV